MKRAVRCDRRAASVPCADTRVRPRPKRGARRRVALAGSRGFTLIELLVAIAILAVIAVLAWRGLDQIIRGRQTITNAMEDERVFAQTFDQMRIDARSATSDDESGSSAISINSNTLQIVRRWDIPGAAPRLMVVRYRISGGHIVRYASPPAANVGELRRAVNGGMTGDWSAVTLMGGVGSISARLYVPKVGWTTNMQDVRNAVTENINNLKVPQLGNAPMPQSVTGIEVSIGATSLARPVVRVFLVGE
jgi:general secretion pathway protein J